MVLQTQLRCTYGFAYICLDILYPKCLIASLIKVNSFTLIVGLCLLLKKSKWITKGNFFSF